MNAERFWKKVAIAGPSDCWPWQSYVAPHGYGRICLSSRPRSRCVRAHRLAYFFHYGVEPGELCVLHSCDNRRCCNPAHLRLGTPADNARDRSLRNRLNPRMGEAHTLARLTEKQVRAILEEAPKIGKGCKAELARRYGVSFSTVASIVNRTSWKHVQ